MPKFQTVVQCLQYWSDTLGDAPAFIFRNRRHGRYVLTWNKLRALSGRFAAVLHGWGLTRGHLVVNTLLNSPERVVCEAGILMSGAASVNGQCLLADGSDLLLTLSKSRASAIVVDPDVANSPWDALKRHVSLADDGSSVTSVSLPELKKVYFARRVEDNSAQDFLQYLETHADWFEANDVTSDDVMSVFCTSGSTGFSKLVPHSHRRFLGSFEQLSDGKILFSSAPLGWGISYFAASLLDGSQRVLCDARGGGAPENMAEFIWRNIQEEKCTIALLPPVLLQQIVKVASCSEQKRNQNIETVAGQNDDISEHAAESPSEGKGVVAMQETDQSDCARSSRNEPGKRGVATERNPGDAAKGNAQSGEPRPSCARNETAAAEREERTDDSPDEGASAAWRLNAVILGGLPVTRPMVQASLLLADSVIIVYGNTECKVLSSLAVQDAGDYADLDNGPVLKGVQVKVVRQDDEDVEASVNQLGHILARCPGAQAGYLNDPQLTAAAFTEDGYFRTGDVGRLDDRGHLFVEGRGGDAIMKGVYILYPAWLEARVCACPGVDSVVVVGVPKPDLHEELCACVVLGSDDVTMTQVREFAEKEIVAEEGNPQSPRPRYYLRFESFPKTSTDKPHRKAIKQLAAEMLGLSISS